MASPPQPAQTPILVTFGPVTPAQTAILIRIVNERPGWGLVTDVYIETNGDDNAAGTSLGSAIATIDEWYSRFGSQMLSVMQTVHLGPGTFSPSSGLMNPRGPGNVRFQGTRTYLPVTGTISVVQNWDGTAHTEGIYTVPGVDFATYNATSGYFLEVVGGGRAGLSITLAKDLGSNQIQSAGGEDMGGFTNAEPSVGDNVQVYSCTKIMPGSDGGTLDGFAVPIGDVVIADLEIGINEGPPNDAHRVYFRGTSVGGEAHGCILHGPDLFNGSWVFSYGSVFIHSHLYGVFIGAANAFLWVTQVRDSGFVNFGDQTLIREFSLVIGGSDGPGTAVIDGMTCISDYSAPVGIRDAGSILQIHAPLWLKNGASVSFGLTIAPGSGIYYDTGLAPAIVGSSPSAYTSVGGTTKTSGQVPFFNVANGAAFVVG